MNDWMIAEAVSQTSGNAAVTAGVNASPQSTTGELQQVPGSFNELIWAVAVA